jgi:hypothetical protein
VLAAGPGPLKSGRPRPAASTNRLEALVLVPESAISPIQSPPSRLTGVSAATSAAEG